MTSDLVDSSSSLSSNDDAGQVDSSNTGSRKHGTKASKFGMAKKKSSVPSPKNSQIVHWKDSFVGYTYVDLPKDTAFVQAVAINPLYKPGMSFYPVQRRLLVNADKNNEYKLETHIYSISYANLELQHVLGPLALQDGATTDIRVFGCTLRKDGMLFLCANNQNCVLGYDLNRRIHSNADPNLSLSYPPDIQINNLPTPNDLVLVEENDADNDASATGRTSSTTATTATSATSNSLAATSTTFTSTTSTTSCCLYVAGGRKQVLLPKLQVGNKTLQEHAYQDSAHGIVYQVDLATTMTCGSSTASGSNNDDVNWSCSYSTKMVTDGHNCLAGISIHDNQLYISRLHDMVRLPLADAAKGKVNQKKCAKFWKGSTSDRQVWLTDTIEVIRFQSNIGQEEEEEEEHNNSPPLLLSPVYRTFHKTLSKLTLENRHGLGASMLHHRMEAGRIKGRSFQQRFENIDFLDVASATYINENDDNDGRPHPVRLVFHDPSRDDAHHHFVIDLEQTSMEHEPEHVQDPDLPHVNGKRHYFNGSITTAHYLAPPPTDIDNSREEHGYIVCVNFEVPRILFLNDTRFREAIDGGLWC